MGASVYTAVKAAGRMFVDGSFIACIRLLVLKIQMIHFNEE